jgi:hypothetical protein
MFKKDLKIKMILWPQFVVPYNTIIFCTDLEPDDLKALRIFRAYIEPTKKLIFLVGEGHSKIKYFRMIEYCKKFQFLTIFYNYRRIWLK